MSASKCMFGSLWNVARESRVSVTRRQSSARYSGVVRLRNARLRPINERVATCSSTPQSWTSRSFALDANDLTSNLLIFMKYSWGLLLEVLRYYTTILVAWQTAKPGLAVTRWS